MNRYEEHRGTSKVNLKLTACAREVTLWTLVRAKAALCLVLMPLEYFSWNHSSMLILFCHEAK